MSHVRILSRALVVLALVGTVLTLAVSPASAQAVQVITFENVEPDDDDPDWQVRVTVVSLGGCSPEQGLGGQGYVSGWLNEGSQGGAALNYEVCSYDFTAQARRNTGEVCDAELAWGTNPAPADYHDALNSGSRANDTVRRVSVRHKSPDATDQTEARCAAAVSVTFEIDPERVVRRLPDHAEDDNLEERVERAVEVTSFAVRVRPHSSTRNLRGCNALLSFTIEGGEDGSVKKSFEGVPTGQTCKFTAYIVNNPAPFVIDDGGTTFETKSGTMTVDLAGQVKIQPARIAIIQDVVGDASDEGVSYAIVRTCAGVDALPPTIVPTGGPGLYRLPGGDWRASLIEGRFTVHSDRAPNFGPAATYHAAARSTTSSVVEGCTVTVTITHVPQGCVVAGGETQALTWRKTRQFEHFDFEFDITCGGAAAGPSTDDDLPASLPAAGTSDDAESTSPDVRIVARKLQNGKIEFGLQQRHDDDTWSDEILPRARLFPTTARVGNWLQSTPLEVNVAEGDSDLVAEIDVRIVARLRSSGSVEFALQQRTDDDSWGSQQLLTRRFFPPDATVGRWLRSSVFTLEN